MTKVWFVDGVFVFRLRNYSSYNDIMFLHTLSPIRPIKYFCLCLMKRMSGRRTPGLAGKSKTSIEALTERLEQIEMDDNQRKKIEVFLCQKEKIGELNDDDFEKLGELGTRQFFYIRI